MKKIFFCCKNSFKTKKVYKKLKDKFPECKFKRKDCLSKCKACKASPFSLFNEKMIQCETSEELYDHLHKKLAKKKK